VAAILPIHSFALGLGLANHSLSQENNLCGWCRIAVIHKGSTMLTLTAELEIQYHGNSVLN
jgi:hypothetical protein